MKPLYIISWSLCLVQLLLFTLTPMAGPYIIVLFVKNGFYDEHYLRTLFENEQVIRFFLSIGKATAYLYFAAIISGTLSILLYRLDKKKKYLVGTVCALLSLLAIVIPKLLGLLV